MRRKLEKYAKWYPLVGTAVGYFLFAWAAQWLAIPPGFASAVWPAAGIALSCVLLFGRTTLIGIWIGSFTVNLWISFSSAHTLTLTHFLISIAIGFGASLQALLGSILVRRFAGQTLDLININQTLRYLLYGGPIGCLLAPTVGAGTLCLLGVIPVADFAFSWWTWWVGDTIGVVLFSPLLIIWFGKPKELYRKRRFTITIPVVTIMIAVFLAFAFTRSFEEERKSQEFERQAQILVNAFRQSLRGVIDTTASYRSFFNSSESVSRDEFTRFSKYYLETQSQIDVIAYAKSIEENERASYENSIKAVGYPEFHISQIGSSHQMIRADIRPHYFPLTFVEPEKNRRILGFDLGSEPKRLRAIEKAISTGNPTISEKIQLAQGGEGVLVLIPVYDSVRRTTSPRHSLIGLISASIRMKEFVQVALSPYKRTGMLISLVDESESANSEVIYCNQLEDFADCDEGSPRKEAFGTDIFAGQRHWRLSFSSTASWGDGQRPWQVWLVLAGGLSLVGLLSVFLLFLTGNALESERIVEIRTRELKESQSQTIQFLDSMPVGVFIFRANGAVYYFNHKAAEISGIESSEGDTLETMRVKSRAFISGTTIPYPLEKTATARALKGEVCIVDDAELYHPDGSIVPISSHGTPIYDDSGKIAFAIVVVIDISERKKIERMKNEFVSMVSHELRTPLTSILGSLGLLTGGVIGNIPEKAISLIEIARQNGERLVGIVNDILDIQRIESGSLKLHIEPIEMKALVRESLMSNQPYADRFGVILNFAEPEDDTFMVRGDKDRIMQIMANLMSNAIKFSKKGEKVTIRLESSGDTVRTSVEDTGPGIPDEFRGRIFQKFAQADTSDTRQKGGSGLGLSIVKAIVDGLDGSIGFSSELGVGSKFYFNLPKVSENFESDLLLNSIEDTKSFLPRILHVENDRSIVDVVRVLVENIATLESTGSIVNAKQLLQRNKYDLLLLDLLLPDGSGLDLTSFLGETKNALIPILVFSIRELTETQASQVSAALIKTKSTNTELLDKIRALLGDRFPNV